MSYERGEAPTEVSSRSMPRPNFIERWLKRVIREALEDFIPPLIERVMERVQILENQNQSIQGTAETQSQEQEPLRSTRPSWPRMKRYLEERDVRAGLAEEATLNSRLVNREADRVEKYWKEKQNAGGNTSRGNSST